MSTQRDLLSGEIVRAVEFLAEVFAARSISHAVIGGIASAIRGRPRFTQDVDVRLDLPQIALPELLDELIERGFTLDALVVMQEFVQHHLTSFRFGRVRVDWLKPVLSLYRRTLAELLEWTDGHSMRVATAEGLILTKMVAFRPRDQEDVEVLLTANRVRIDIDLIKKEEWSPFAAAEGQRTAWLEEAIARRVVRLE
jgi:hypothetical protein